MAKVKFATQYDPNEDPGIGDWGPSLTQQHFKDLVDPSAIMQKFLKTGIIDAGQVHTDSLYIDCSTVPSSYEQCLSSIRSAAEAYESLPANVRQHFGNPDEFVRQTMSDEGMKKFHDLMNPGSSVPADPRAAGGKAPEGAAADGGGKGEGAGAAGSPPAKA